MRSQRYFSGNREFDSMNDDVGGFLDDAWNKITTSVETSVQKTVQKTATNLTNQASTYISTQLANVLGLPKPTPTAGPVANATDPMVQQLVSMGLPLDQVNALLSQGYTPAQILEAMKPKQIVESQTINAPMDKNLKLALYIGGGLVGTLLIFSIVKMASGR